MSGVELLGVLSAVITVLDATTTLYQRARKDIRLSETFEVAARRLPVLLHILQTFKSTLEPLKDSLSSDVCEALEETLNNCEEKARRLSEIFTKVLSGPTDSVSWRQRYSKIVHRLGQRNKVDLLMIAITQDVQLLVNCESIGSVTPSQNTELETILNEMKDHCDTTLLEDGFSLSFHSSGAQNNNVNSGNGQLNTGSGQQINTHARVKTQTFNFAVCCMQQSPMVSHYEYYPNIIHNDDFSFRRPLGICLDQAPSMSPGLFVGREAELSTIRKDLHPTGEGRQRKQQQQQRLAIGGIGGVGKTQIALTYAQTPHTSYETVLWFNADTEISLKNSFVTAAGLIFGSQVSESLEGNEAVRRTREWLSDPHNSKWLLIFDNYDNPSDFKLDCYYPPAAHGAIIITTRQADQVIGRTALLDIKPFQSVENSLTILETRSKRDNLLLDLFAVQLAERLAGLPLALATAGAYLQKSPFTFQRYLEEYENRWNIDPRRPVKLQEYQERTLYTTWEISYNRLMEDDPEAAAMLRIMAYFDNQNLWYELFHAGLNNGCPLYEVVSDDINFNGAMTVLAEYSFLEFHPGLKEWSMHKCVHDWVSATLSKAVGPQGYWYAFDCVSESIGGSDEESLAYPHYSRYVPHAKHLGQGRFLKSDIIEMITPERLGAVRHITSLLVYQIQYESAERLLKSFLQSQAAHDPDDEVTLLIMHDLGYLCLAQMKYSEAKELLGRALSGMEKIPGANDSSVARMRINLGYVYTHQGDYRAAEQMYLQAVFGKDVAADEHILAILPLLERIESGSQSSSKHNDFARLCWGLKIAHNEKLLIHSGLVTDVLDVADGICDLLEITGKKDEAERILKQIILIRENLQGPAHSSTLSSVMNLALFYKDPGKFNDAEKLYDRVFAEREKLYGPNHYSTIRVLQHLGHLHSKQKRFQDAEDSYTRALKGLKRTFGQYDERTINAILDLAFLYVNHGKSVAAEQMYTQALTMREALLGSSDPLTLDIAARLGHLYLVMHRLDDAENMLLRVLGYPSSPQAVGLEAINRSDAALNLSSLYMLTKRLDDAERLLLRMSTVIAQTPGPYNQQVLLHVSYNLASVWLGNGQLDKAEEEFIKIREGCKDVWGSEHPLRAALSQSLATVYEQKQFQ
ncbi:Tetratricopeptide repeat [Aspergillus parasiticus SU-1]|uniref:Tetratricopeptide repeat n=1 Tax=Aspergillus parasiticus (strain ATCC 56775 / NRRL 5862 / SRRC 143 / SU-1) TaxID=1403190 RepID=A0A0F0I332_ASPPU|nr:Tetratricopeptide repeat [Aspergillus parasiticus SU-1]